MKFIILTIVIFLCSCTVTNTPVVQGPKFEYTEIINSQLVTIWIYRPDRKISNLCWPQLNIENKKIVSLLNSGYTKILIKPGKYNFTSIYSYGKPESPSLADQQYNRAVNFTFKEGNEYFLKFNVISSTDLNISSIGSSTVPYAATRLVDVRWQLVEKNIALEEIKNTSYIAPETEIIN